MEITEQETLPVYPLVTLRFIFLPSYGYRFSFFWNLIQMIKSDRRDYVYALNLVPTQQHCGSCVCDFQLSARAITLPAVRPITTTWLWMLDNSTITQAKFNTSLSYQCLQTISFGYRALGHFAIAQHSGAKRCSLLKTANSTKPSQLTHFAHLLILKIIRTSIFILSDFLSS